MPPLDKTAGQQFVRFSRFIRVSVLTAKLGGCLPLSVFGGGPRKSRRKRKVRLATAQPFWSRRPTRTERSYQWLIRYPVPCGFHEMYRPGRL